MSKKYKSAGRTIDADVSAYYAKDDRMQGGKITALGNPVGRGRVAVDPKVIPLGSKMFIPGYGWATADDTGGAIKGNRVDLGHGANEGKLARDYGHQYHKVSVYPKGTDVGTAKTPQEYEQRAQEGWNFQNVVRPVPKKPVEKAANQQFAGSAISNKSALGTMMMNSQAGLYPPTANPISMQQMLMKYGKR